MPKATLTFDLPEERHEYQAAIDGAAWKFIVYNTTMFLRDKLKYGHDYRTVNIALEAVKDAIWQRCRDENLDPWGE